MVRVVVVGWGGIVMEWWGGVVVVEVGWCW